MSHSTAAPKTDVCVVGSFMMDFAARVDRRPAPGETVIGDRLDISLGGKGFNQAVAAARSGAVARMHGCLGDDEFATRFLTALADEGILAETIIYHPDHGTGIGLPVVDRHGENSIVVVPRANAYTGPQALAALERAVSSCRVLLLQLEIPFELSKRAASIARRGGATVVLNPAPAEQPLHALSGLADVLVPNRTEAAQLVGETDPGRAAALLRKQTGASVVVTLDADGAVVLGCDDSGPRHVPSHPVPIHDTIGAGDAFCGALGARLAQGDDLYDAVLYSNAAGAICVTRTGASTGIPAAWEIEEFLGQFCDPV